MAERKVIGVRIPHDLAQALEDHKTNTGKKTDTEAVIDLLRLALNLEDPTPSPK